MASSDPHRINGDQVEEEEDEEYEYEEVEEEDEEYEYEEVEEFEEVEEVEEEEEFEEVEEEVEEPEEEEEEPEEEEEVEEPEKEEVEEPEEEQQQDEDVQEEEEEEEYEEVEEEEEYEEVEEEIEVEEEVTDEEDATMAEADDEGAAEIIDTAIAAVKSISPIPIVADVAFNDGSQDVEPKRDEVYLNSGHTSAVKSEASILCAAEGFCPDGRCSSPEPQNVDEKEISSIDFASSRSSKLVECIAGPSNNESDTMKDKQGHLEQPILVSAAEDYASAPDAVSDQLGEMEKTDVEGSKQLLVEASFHFPSRKETDEKESRSCVPRVRRRSLSPGADSEDGNKRPAIICEFFAKGWCIKGGSCRFLHKIDHVGNATQVDEDTLHTKSELRPDKGPEENSDLIGYKQPGTCVENHDDYLFARKDISKERGEGLKLRQHEAQDNVALLERMASSSLVSADSQKSSCSKDGSRSISTPREVKAEILKENYSSDLHGSVAEGSSMLRQNFFPGCGSSFREFGVISESDSIVRLVEESAAMRRRYSLDVQSSVPSYHTSRWKSSSLLHNSTFFSGSDSEKSSDVHHARNQLISLKYKTTFTPYKWELSVPFRSSYLVPPVKRSSDIQYDPFRDSIEQPDAGGASLRQSSFGQTQDVQSTSGRNSLELHKKIQIDNWNKTHSGHDKVVPAVEAESAATSASDAQHKNLTEEENPMIPGSVKAILKASRNINDVNSKVEVLLGHGEVEVEKCRQPNEFDDEESKAIKYFRAALIEFVKELMKPIWHEGRLSKDVYKVIVQKAEDKILSTLQPNQVPSSSESIKQYLSSSRTKILKLIQAYVDKYGRF